MTRFKLHLKLFQIPCSLKSKSPTAEGGLTISMAKFMKNEETKEIKTELESDDVKSEMDISIGDEEFVDFKTLANCNGDTQDTATDIKHEIADFIKREIDETNIKTNMLKV